MNAAYHKSEQIAAVEPLNLFMSSSNPNLENIDSDSGLEVVEEPSLRPSELIRSKHNRTMSTISGKKYNFKDVGMYKYIIQYFSTNGASLSMVYKSNIAIK